VRNYAWSEHSAQRYVPFKVKHPPVTDENVAEQIPCAAWVLGYLHGAVMLD
jgi:hypothetical protein